jgi:hypothetical protein
MSDIRLLSVILFTRHRGLLLQAPFSPSRRDHMTHPACEIEEHCHQRKPESQPTQHSTSILLFWYPPHQPLAAVLRQNAALTLGIGGQPDPGPAFYQRRMQRLASELGVATHIVCAGQLTPLEMAWCFEHCAAFVTTSRAEACPHTAMEAMSHDWQVVSTCRPPMPAFFQEIV